MLPYQRYLVVCSILVNTWRRFHRICTNVHLDSGINNRLKYYKISHKCLWSKPTSLWHRNVLEKLFFFGCKSWTENEIKTVFNICLDTQFVTLILGAHLETVVIVEISCICRKHLCVWICSFCNAAPIFEALSAVMVSSFIENTSCLWRWITGIIHVNTVITKNTQIQNRLNSLKVSSSCILRAWTDMEANCNCTGQQRQTTTRR